MYFPDAYRFIEIKQPDDTLLIKIFSSWRGGYLHGDSWRINSGIIRIEEDGDEAFIHGYSGSVYCINRENPGSLTSFTSSVLNDLLDKLGDDARIVDYEYVKEKLNALHP